jgi:hypothetical protein
MTPFLLWTSLSGALAAEIAVLGVHEPGRDAAEQEAFAALMVKAIERSKVHDGLLPAEVAARYAGREDLILQEAFLFEAKRRMEDGRLMYQQADPEGAVEVLLAAVRMLEESVRWSRSVRDLWEAWMLLGTARLAVGDEPAARDAIGQAYALHPARRPDPASFAPEVLELWENERDMGGVEQVKLIVSVDVEGSRVWLDGRDVGASPVTIKGVPPGRHHVHARTPAGMVGYTAVEVPPGVDKPVAVSSAPPQLGAAAKGGGARSAQLGALYEAVGRYAGVDLVLLVGRIDDVPQLQLFSPESDTFARPVVLSATATDDDIASALSFVVDQLGPDGALASTDTAYTALPLDISTNTLLARDLYAPIAPAVPLPPEQDPDAPGRDDPPEVTRAKWPVWLGVGLGAAAVIAGGVVAGVVLSEPGEAPPSSGGTITIGPPLR